MLCNVIEKGMYKCAQYWPNEEKESKKINDQIEVTNTQVRVKSRNSRNPKHSFITQPMHLYSFRLCSRSCPTTTTLSVSVSSPSSGTSEPTRENGL